MKTLDILKVLLNNESVCQLFKLFTKNIIRLPEVIYS